MENIKIYKVSCNSGVRFANNEAEINQAKQLFLDGFLIDASEIEVEEIKIQTLTELVNLLNALAKAGDEQP